MCETNDTLSTHFGRKSLQLREADVAKHTQQVERLDVREAP
jgi:hypothetical protein